MIKQIPTKDGLITIDTNEYRGYYENCITLQMIMEWKIEDIQSKTIELREIGMTYVKDEKTMLFNMNSTAQVNYTGYHNMVLEELVREVHLLDYENIYFIGTNITNQQTPFMDLMQFTTQEQLLDFAHAIKDFMIAIYTPQFTLIMQVMACTTIEQVCAIVDTR